MSEPRPQRALLREHALSLRLLLPLAASLLALGLPTLSSQLLAQGTGRIAGTVSDSAGGFPVAAVQVLVIGTSLSAQTQSDGRYSIGGIPPGTYSVEARRLGYASTRRTGVVIDPDQTATVDLRIVAASLRLQEVVITGVTDPTAGTRMPFTVGRVTREDAPIPPVNAIAGVQGKIAGVMMVPSGQPGDGVSIFLRTPGSINKTNTPLIVVDGVILAEPTTGGGSLTTADLNALDIESIEVVKGAAGASLYGSRASNGVIQIRTRRGNDLGLGRTQFSLRSELGKSDLAREIKWAQHHYYLVNSQGQWVDTLGNVVSRSQRVARPAAQRFQDQPYGDPVYNPVEQFFDPGEFVTNSFTIRQNGEKTNFLTTLSQQKIEGVLLENGGYVRRDMRINLDHRPRSDVLFSLSGFHSRSDRDELDGNPFFDLINLAPDVNLAAPDTIEGTRYIFQPDPEGIRVNPLYTLSTRDAEDQRIRTLGALDLRYTPRSWLTLDANLSYDRSDRNGSTFIDRGVKTPNYPTGDIGFLELRSGLTDAINASTSASVLGTFDLLTARGTFRVLTERQRDKISESEGVDFAVAGVPRMTAARVRDNSSQQTDIEAQGYFVALGADYDGRYILDGLFRRDGSSLFGPDEKWNSYYRTSAAYRIAEESWWPWPRVNEFKLRFSRGTAGNRPSFADQYETYSIQSGGALEKSTLGNRFLKPEHRTENETGLDMIVDNRYSLQLSHASSVTVDELVQIPLPGAVGFTTQWQNAGTVVGNTLEATLEAQILQRRDVGWKFGLIADRSRHHISEFNRSCVRAADISFRCVGEDLSTMWGNTFLSSKDQLPTVHANSKDQFDVNDDGLLVAVGSGGKYTDPGKFGTTVTIDGVAYPWGMPIRLRDANNLPAVVRMGSGNPRFHWGVTNNVRWRNFQFYGLVDALVGGDIYNATKQRQYQWARSGDEDQAGKPPERKKPIDYYVLLYNGNTVTSWFVEPGGYVKIREMSVQYRLPQSMISRLRAARFTGASINVTGRNLYTWTKYSGYDPDVGTAVNRLDSFDFPAFRTFTATIELDW